MVFCACICVGEVVEEVGREDARVGGAEDARPIRGGEDDGDEAEEADGVAVDAQVTVTAKDLGTRALLQGVVLTSPDSGTVVAGARNAPAVGLQWIDEDGVSTAESAWTTRLTCTHAPLNAGSYEAHGFAVTVDQEGATHIVLSDPWTVDVVEGDAAA